MLSINQVLVLCFLCIHGQFCCVSNGLCAPAIADHKDASIFIQSERARSANFADSHITTCFNQQASASGLPSFTRPQSAARSRDRIRYIRPPPSLIAIERGFTAPSPTLP